LWCHSLLAFQNSADRHNFPPDFPSVEVVTGLMSMLHTDPGFTA
jgi:hypothetical protein